MMGWEPLVKSLIGKPFLWNGRGPEAFDCWGLVEHVLDQRGIPHPCIRLSVLAESYAEATIESSRYMQQHVSDARWQRTDDLEVGAVLALSSHRRIHHVGIVTPFGVLHTTPAHGAILQSVAQLKASGYQRIEGYRWVA